MKNIEFYFMRGMYSILMLNLTVRKIITGR